VAEPERSIVGRRLLLSIRRAQRAGNLANWREEHGGIVCTVGKSILFMVSGLNEALHRKGEREHEQRIGAAAPLIPQRSVAQPSKTPVIDPVQKYFDNLEAMGKDLKTIRTYRAAVNGFVASYKKPSIEDYERQDLIDYMGWLRKQPRKERLSPHSPSFPPNVDLSLYPT
jgi:Phage integrase, N-terminal SAM-like domain